MTHYSIKRLADMLLDHCVPFELTEDAMGNEKNQIWYPSKDKPICDVICHKYSYGHERGLLEMMGLTTKEEDEIYFGVVGYLTPEEAFECIWRHWFDNHEQVLVTMTSEDDDY